LRGGQPKPDGIGGGPLNPKGHHKSLIPAQPGNRNAVKRGVFSEQTLASQIEEHRATLRGLPWMQPVDDIAIGEVGKLLARIDAVDGDLAERGHFGRNGARTLLEHRARLSRELRAWLKDLGALPSERASWSAKLGGGLAAAIQRRLEEAENGG
jgi:hypothetical protein